MGKFSAIIPELDNCIYETMDAIIECDCLDKLEEYEDQLHDKIDALDKRMDTFRKIQRKLTKRLREIVKGIKHKLIGSNKQAEQGRRKHIDIVKEVIYA